MAMIAGWLISCFAGITQTPTSQPGYQHFKIDKVDVTALSDGTVPVSANQLLHAKEQAGVSELLGEAYLTDPVEVSINAYLIRNGNKLILIDAGAGALFGPTHGGKLISNLEAAGFSPDQVTDILITHIHLDHSGGLSLNGIRQFPNAMVHVNAKEIAFWKEHQTPQATESRGITDNRPAFEALKPYQDAGKVVLFANNTILFDGIRTKEVVGHTPGHTVFVLQSEKEKLVFWGDLIHIEAVQFHRPEIDNEFDVDKEKAAAQRQTSYEEASAKGYLVAADHISFPGIGRVKKDGAGYRWLPLAYSLLSRTR
jgi:glyoxylase-like metal-dependent hydrolase (beta-lactamase superfamily II)